MAGRALYPCEKGKVVERPGEIRFVTYLSPSIPRSFFEAVAEHISRGLGSPVTLSEETAVSGPAGGEPEPFSNGAADVGFMCAPSFLWLNDLASPPVELLGAPVFGDARNGGRAVYFSEVVVRRDSPARSFEDLLGCSWAYNDDRSLSGYYSLLEKLSEAGGRGAGKLRHSGSHLDSLQLVARGGVDAAAIDSNVLALQLSSEPGLGRELRILESWGPYAVQPVVVRTSLDRDTRALLRESLLGNGAGPEIPISLASFGLQRFAPVVPEDYAAERQTLRACHNAYLP